MARKGSGWPKERHRHSMAAKGVKTTMDPQWYKLGKDLASGKHTAVVFVWDVHEQQQAPIDEIAHTLRNMGKDAELYYFNYDGNENVVVVATSEQNAINVLKQSNIAERLDISELSDSEIKGMIFEPKEPKVEGNLFEVE